jgi:hypothetical protein
LVETRRYRATLTVAEIAVTPVEYEFKLNLKALPADSASFIS